MSEATDLIEAAMAAARDVQDHLAKTLFSEKVEANNRGARTNSRFPLHLAAITRDQYRDACVAAAKIAARIPIGAVERENLDPLLHGLRIEFVNTFVNSAQDKMYPTSSFNAEVGAIASSLPDELDEIRRRVVKELRIGLFGEPQTSVTTRPASSNTESRGLAWDGYVSLSRIAEIKSLKSDKFDFSRLIRMCEELNSSFESEALMSIAAICRALTDHAPPIFGQPNFAAVASNYGGGGRSFSDHMKSIETSLRKVADGHLHQQIRKVETLPTAQQVDFRAAIDALLSEIARVITEGR